MTGLDMQGGVQGENQGWVYLLGVAVRSSRGLAEMPVHLSALARTWEKGGRGGSGRDPAPRPPASSFSPGLRLIGRVKWGNALTSETREGKGCQQSHTLIHTGSQPHHGSH